MDEFGKDLERKELTQGEQKKFYKNVGGSRLIQLSDEERKRIAKHIIQEYREAKPAHEELCDKIDKWDEVHRVVREDIQGSDGNLPNYRMPISTVAHEVIHANIMNVFFTPAETMRVLPTAQDDISKVENITTFGNWSMKNEMDLFHGCDRLFHASEKDGESVYMVYWKKEYAVDFEREVRTDEEGNTLYDEVTQEPLYDEREVTKLVYNAPCLEVISRKDYIQPEDAVMGKKPRWEARIVTLSYDEFLKSELKGDFYKGTTQLVRDWPVSEKPEIQRDDYDGDTIPVGKWKKQFIEFYGTLRITAIKRDLKENEEVEFEELDDEFIALVNIETETLCFIKKNRFPMKMRPFGVDYMIPDDTGRRAGIGIYEFMDSLQKAYDILFNNFINSTDLSNNPIVFFQPTGNMRDEQFKIQRGFAYPTSDAGSVKLFQFPGPNASIQFAMELVSQWAQFLFGISDYAAGMESNIDPSAPAKKVEIVVQQGNVRLNMIIKRKNAVLQDIFKRWFLLYRDNMPANKFMRISGQGNDPFKFQEIKYEDFSLKSIPDFELTGNVLNANKQLELNKAVAMYRLLSTNPLFAPQTKEGLQGLMAITKWLVSKVDDIGLKQELPQFKEGDIIHTPEEENAYFLQGEEVEPLPGEDWQYHIKVHSDFLNNPNTPEEVRPLVAQHIKDTMEIARQDMAMRIAMQQQALSMPSPEQFGGQGGRPEQGTPGEAGGLFQEQPAVMG